jgi:hypothetical protein
MRRAGVGAAAAIRRALVVAAVIGAAALPACASSDAPVPTCATPVGDLIKLMAQSVPSATQVPCIRSFPLGWSYAGSDVRSGVARFWLDSDRAGGRAVEVGLAPACATGGATPVSPSPDESGIQVLEEPLGSTPGFSANRYLVFSGGCVTYRYRFAAGAAAALAEEADEALSLIPRSIVVSQVEDQFDLSLCGAEAPPCAG